jgi:peptide/nickel transport system permease protein
MKNSFFKKNKLQLGFLMVGCLVLIAALAPFFTAYRPDAIDASELLSGPSLKHWLGTDQLGRDVFSRLVYGGRISLSVGLIAIVLATFIGVVLGGAAGYYGGIVDYLLMRFTDMMLCFPVLFLILAVIAMLEPSVFNIIFILGCTSWMGQARLMRAEVLSLKNKEFVLAARAYGASDILIMCRHLVPNAFGPILVSAVLGVANAILAESSLSFLGLGIQPPTPSWGNMLNDAKMTLGVAWWLNIFPGLAILITILGYNLLAEGTRDHLTKTA